MVDHFRFSATLKMHGLGKCGLVFRINDQTRDGYYLSLDLLKEIAQLRAWGTGEDGSGEHMMQFRSLQSGFWFSKHHGTANVQLIAFGSYIELSIDGRVILSLADQTYNSGHMGVYVESSELRVADVTLTRLASPRQTDEHLASG